MQVGFQLEYHTRWGEGLCLVWAGHRVAMHYTEGGIWRVECLFEEEVPLTYHYEVWEGERMTRREWGEHTLSEVENNPLRHDCWLDMPANAPFHTKPFAEGLFTPHTDKMWRGAGCAIPLFSLRSQEDFGVGEFCDLKGLVDWAVATGQCLIQLLPINDTTMHRTWADSYPYNANSTMALHPQFIRLTEVGVAEDEEYCRLRAEVNALPTVDYERVNRLKEGYLRKAYASTGREVLRKVAFKRWFAENRAWLVPYAVYSVLRDVYKTCDFAQWGAYAHYCEERVEDYAKREREAVGYYYFVQYHLHCQLAQMHAYAHSRGVALKGDLPIGVSRTSVDAWQYPHLFHLDSQAGAPPDAFSATGQNWGFPTYNWERMAEDDYAWWRARLRQMERYFDAYRIDHILGFFRIWEIPIGLREGLLGHFNPAMPYSEAQVRQAGFDLAAKGVLVPMEGEQTDGLFVEDPRRKGYYHPRIGAHDTSLFRRLSEAQQRAFDRLHEEFFYHRHDAFWQESACRKLPVLLSSSAMLACGEDLGMIPACVPETMQFLKILSLEIQRMPKRFGEPFADPATYPYLAVCTTSTHDMNPLRAWWEEDEKIRERFYHEVLRGEGDAPHDCTPEICRQIVQMHLSSPAMLTVLPLQDWLSVDGALRHPDPHAERINIPANPRHYWRYRMHLPLEKLLSAEAFNNRLRAWIVGSGRI